MKEKKKCIFHYLHPIDNNPVGSAVRPYMMLNALRNCGYEVEEITGYGKERKIKIKKLLKKIENGEQFEFLYSESLTEPNLLAEKNHVPLHPLIDACLFKKCKKNGIPIGLFYRDIYWKYDVYKKSVPFYKRMISIPMYYMDLALYKKYVKILFCPTREFSNVLKLNIEKEVLPPGCCPKKDVFEYKSQKECFGNPLKLFYVGSIHGTYNISKIIEAVKNCSGVKFTICTPKDQWENYKHEYEDVLCDRVEIVHKRGDELKEYYKETDVSIYCLKPNSYLDIASPIKCKETLGYGTPMIVSKNTAVASDILGEYYGWGVEYDTNQICDLLRYLVENPEEIKRKTQNAINVSSKNTWESRVLEMRKRLLE